MASISRRRRAENPKLVEDDFFKKIEFTWVGKKILLRVYDQGDCCCCWACAATGAITALDAIKRKRAVIPLSIQQLIDCLLQKYPIPDLQKKLKEKECPELSPQLAFKFAKHHGIVEEDKYPYKMERGDCECPPRDALIIKINGYTTIDIEKRSKRHIERRIKKQPITCNIDVYWSFNEHIGQDTYMGMAVEETEEDFLGIHVVLIVGYGEDETGEEIYLIQNTWGKEWGYNGFAKIARNLAYNLSYPLMNEA